MLAKKKRAYLRATIAVIESSKGGFLMQVVLRLQPVQTFGLTNGFFGVFTTIPMCTYITTTLIGSEHTIIMLTSIGMLVKDMGSLEEAANSDQGQINLFVTVG